MIDETDLMIPISVVKSIVQQTINELKQQDLLHDFESSAYSEVSERLMRYFTPLSVRDDDLSQALEFIKNDKYKHILWMFYRDGYTLEEIAERLNVDVRTVSRNKKRLCLAIYMRLHS